MSKQPQRGTERCHGNFLRMGRTVKDPCNRPMNGANSREGEGKDNKKSTNIFEWGARQSYLLIIASICTWIAFHCGAEFPHRQHLCEGAVSPLPDPCLSSFPSCSHRFMAPQCPLLTHLPAVHLKAIIIKERAWSNSIPLLSQGTATGSHCWAAQGGFVPWAVASTWHLQGKGKQTCSALQSAVPELGDLSLFLSLWELQLEESKPQ